MGGDLHGRNVEESERLPGRPRLDGLYADRQVRELATLDFVSEGTNLLLLGTPRVGKTHLTVALALRVHRERGPTLCAPTT